MQVVCVNETEIFLACRACYGAHFNEQWKTHAVPNQRELITMQANKISHHHGLCEFCGQPLLESG